MENNWLIIAVVVVAVIIALYFFMGCKTVCSKKMDQSPLGGSNPCDPDQYIYCNGVCIPASEKVCPNCRTWPGPNRSQCPSGYPNWSHPAGSPWAKCCK